MTFDEIIRDFANSEFVPAEAVHAALAAPAAFVEKAIPLLDRVAGTTSCDEEDDALAVLVHVLGEIGDESAFLPLMRVLALPKDELYAMLSDSITETLGNVLISLVGDRAAVLEQALADTSIDAFARSSIFRAWTRLALDGTVPREKAEAFLSDYPVRVGLDQRDFGWSSWVDAVTAIGFAEMSDFVRQNLPDRKTRIGSFDIPDVTYKDFERQLAKALAEPAAWKEDPIYQPFAGTVGELSSWYGYSEEFRRKRARGETEEGAFEDDNVLTAPYVAANIHRDIGRNDPCPCGSGKKFKKCCLG